MKNNQGINPSEAAAALGRIKTEKKAASSAENVKHAQAARQAKRKKLVCLEALKD